MNKNKDSASIRISVDAQLDWVLSMFGLLLRHLLRHLLRQGYEGQEGYEAQVQTS
jgi:hypothetical protein